MMNIKEINSAIMFGDLTNDDLNSIGDAIRYRRSQLTTQTRRSLSLGCAVKFTNSRTGQLVTGKVDKINRKFVIVNAGFTRWRVPANMLETV
jgi:hypothetical protein